LAWDLVAAQRARALVGGLLSGGFGEDERMKAVGYRVCEDPSDVLHHLDEIGIRGDF
jgi:phosphoglycolate phosphatase-like HAD superfamily hydrolase